MEEGQIGETRLKNFVTYFDRFLDHITSQQTGAPLDFFSFHIYNNDAREIVAHSEYVRERLVRYGLNTTEIHLNEWNYGGPDIFEAMRRMEGGCHVAATLCRLQRSPVHMAMYYDAVPRQRYGGLFKLMTNTPSKAYYPIQAFGELHRLGYEAEQTCDSEELHFLAATDGRDIAAIASNDKDEDIEVSVNINGLQPDTTVQRFLLDADHDLAKVEESSGPDFHFALKARSVVFLTSKTTSERH
jgi:hypothetical protein